MASSSSSSSSSSLSSASASSSSSSSRFVRVLYSFNAEEAGELSVRAGELYLLKGASSSGPGGRRRAGARRGREARA